MILKVEDLRVKYGQVEVLHGINLTIREGEIVAILGANGAGKSTTLMAISGLVKPSAGRIFLDDFPLHETPAHEIVNRGVAQVPEGRRVFGTLTVAENLRLGAFSNRNQEQVEQIEARIYELCPVLKQRRDQLAGTLSGGEQQMLAIGRALMAGPKILLLDEPSLRLAPILVKTIFRTIQHINESGMTIVLVEQNARAALKLAHRGYVFEVGRVVLENSAEKLLADPNVQNAYLGGVA